MQTLNFDNQFTAHLPADHEVGSSRRQLHNAIYARVKPTPVKAPSLVAFSTETAALLGLSETDCHSSLFLNTMSGNHILPGMDPHATCYGGHQFGNWAGQLGDGRAINLGEVTPAGLPGSHYMLQLKGAGPTPFSRTADGLAVLRSSVREFLCSEAMHHLGVPTTRALSLVNTGEGVMRDMLYDGNPAVEPGAVVCRVSPSFVRFGHFQMLAARGEDALLKQFTDYVIHRDFAHLSKAQTPTTETYLQWFEEVCSRTAKLMVHWMRIGFVHGVMNTDNMSILGETIDYGPYGWLEDFDPDWTPNTTDATHRRYRYGQQPAVAQWNLMQLANAILPLAGDPKPFEDALSNFAQEYADLWQQMMAQKLGLKRFNQSLVDDLMGLLTTAETDMTLFFRLLAKIDPGQEATYEQLRGAYYREDQWGEPLLGLLTQWLKAYQQTLTEQSIQENNRVEQMNAVNPKYVLRNYLAQLAIDDADNGDYAKVNTLLEVLRKPYDEQPEHEQYAGLRPDWARSRVGCSMLSCSS